MSNVSAADRADVPGDVAPAMSAAPKVIALPEHAWCRACGADVPASVSGTCPACHWSLEPAGFPDSLVGMMFSAQGRMLVNKRLGICVSATGTEAHIHYSSKDTQAVPMAELPAIDENKSRRNLSPSARLQAAVRAAAAGDLHVKWDSTILLEAAGAWAQVTIGAMRSLADEAIGLGWTEIIEWIGLSDQEKAWRHAHSAAEAGDHALLLEYLGKLPQNGYRERVDLAMPFLPVALQEPAAWISVLGLDGDRHGKRDQAVLDILRGNPTAGLARVGELLTENAWPERGTYW